MVITNHPEPDSCDLVVVVVVTMLVTKSGLDDGDWPGDLVTSYGAVECELEPNAIKCMIIWSWHRCPTST